MRSLNPTSASANYSVGYYYLTNWRVLSPVDKERATSILQRTISLSHRYSNMIFDKAWKEMGNYDDLKQIIPDTPESHVELKDPESNRIGSVDDRIEESKRDKISPEVDLERRGKAILA